MAFILFWKLGYPDASFEPALSEKYSFHVRYGNRAAFQRVLRTNSPNSHSEFKIKASVNLLHLKCVNNQAPFFYLSIQNTIFANVFEKHIHIYNPTLERRLLDNGHV